MEIWNSLEIVKIIVGVLSPIAVVIIGFWINSRLKNIDHSLWVNQKVIERRLILFDEMAPSLNDLLCYFTYIGLWKDRTPDQIIDLKRKLDQIAHVNYPLFSTDFLENYNSLIDLCFETYTGWGSDAKLRTKYSKRKEAFSKEWCEPWDDSFSNNRIPEPTEVEEKYLKLMTFFSNELGITLNRGK